MPLHPCPSCACHVAADVCTCPHCGSSVCTRERKLPAAALLMGLALTGCVFPTPQPKYGVAIDSSFVDTDEDGYAADEDCNDDDATIHPGAVETPGDGVDSNCDDADDT